MCLKCVRNVLCVPPRRRGYPEIAEYMETMCDHDKTYMYRFIELGLTTHGHSTSNIAESIMMVIKKARRNDAYHFIDWLCLWVAGKFAESQQKGARLVEEGALLTTYAQKILGMSEALAQYEVMTAQPLGNGKHKVVHSLAGGKKRQNIVDLKNGSCTCRHWITNHIPCADIVFCVDKAGQRDTPAKMLAFREKWIPAYFWAENYHRAYSGITLQVPAMDLSGKVSVRAGDRIVLPPPSQRAAPKESLKKRQGKGGGKRSRAIWDRAGYERRCKSRLGTSGPTNDFVVVSHPTIFHRQPRGSCRVGFVDGITGCYVDHNAHINHMQDTHKTHIRHI